MSYVSPIEWTETTWNPVRGCKKLSPGCKHCYAETFAERFRGVAAHPYEQGFDFRLVPEALGLPLRWRKPRTIFVNSMSDLFYEEVPDEYIAAVFGVMAASEQHTFQVLTKRADRLPRWLEWLTEMPGRAANGHWFQCMREASDALLDYVSSLEPGESIGPLTGAWPVPNVWLGVSVEDRRYGLPRIAHLREVPAAVRFLSIEPLLEDLGELDLTGIHWVIVGGESGPGARPVHPAWARSIRDQCVAADVPFFFKQWGAWVPVDQPWSQPNPKKLAPNERWMNADEGHGFHGPEVWRMRRTMKKHATRELDGRTWDEMPPRARAR